MNCEAFEIRLNEVLDQRRLPSDDESLSAHAGMCPQCSAMLHGVELLAERCEQAPSPVPPAGLAHQVMAELLVEKTHARQAWWPKAAWAAAAVAAGLILVPVVALVLSLGAQNANNQGLAKGNGGGAGSAGSLGMSEPGPSSGESIAETNQVARRSRLGPSPFSTGGNIVFAISFSPIDTIELPEIDEERVSAVKPLADTINVLVDVIWHAIPGLRYRPIDAPVTPDYDDTVYQHVA